MADKMRAALEAAREWISFDKQDTSLEGCQRLLQQIDEALKSEPDTNPDDALEAFKQTKQQLEDMKQFILMQGGGHIRNQLLNLPDQIRAQSLEVAKTAELIETRRTVLDKKKNDHRLFITSATETDEKGKTKQKFGNEDARRAAVESLIAEDASYAEVHDSLVLKEALLKRQEIDLTHLNNLFRAYLAIAGMQGVR